MEMVLQSNLSIVYVKSLKWNCLLAGGGVNAAKHKGILGQLNYSVWPSNDGRMAKL